VSKLHQQVKANAGNVGESGQFGGHYSENSVGWDVSNSMGRGGKVNSSKWTIVPTYFDSESNSAGISATQLGLAAFSGCRQPWNRSCDGEWCVPVEDAVAQLQPEIQVV
jgi:hypothetical protein